jgi:hypothetical protein
MRSRLQRCLVVLALYAVTAHMVLLGFVPLRAGDFATLDPFAFICHTTGPATSAGEPPPGTLHFVPGRAIDHCNLAGATAAPPPPDNVLDVDLRPGRILHVLHPISAAVRTAARSDPKRARAPPLFA